MQSNVPQITHPMLINPANVVFGQPGKYSTKVNHVYHVAASNNPYQPFQTIQFQDGTLNGQHIDGVRNEDLILMVIDRLKGFQAAEFACRENALALTKLEESLHWLSSRTQARRARGVEGTNVQ